MPTPTLVMVGPPPRCAPVSAGLVLTILALLLSLQPVTTDLYLPALPTITHALGAPVAAGQLTLSALLLAFGLSQLLWGPVSDRWGRRPVLLIGLLLYVVASLGSAAASTMSILIGWRIGQGAAMGAVVVCARAIVRDVYDPLAGARAMAKVLTGLGIIASIGPALGGVVVQTLGWRAALLVLTGYSVLTLALVWLRLPETVQHPHQAYTLQPRMLLGTWGTILRHPTFWTYSLLTCASYGGLFCFLAASPFVFTQVLGLSRTELGGVLCSSALAYFVGTILCRWLLRRWGLGRSVAVAGVLSLTGGSLMALAAHMGFIHIWALLVPFYLFMVGHGIHQPCGQVGAIGPFAHAAGAASALNGFLMMAVAFVMGLWLGTQLNPSQPSVWPLVYGVWAWSIVLALIAWWPVQKLGISTNASAHPQ